MYIYIYIYIHACLHGPKYMYCQWTAREGLSTYNTDSGSRTNSSNRINSSDISSSDNQVTWPRQQIIYERGLPGIYCMCWRLLFWVWLAPFWCRRCKHPQSCRTTFWFTGDLWAFCRNPVYPTPFSNLQREGLSTGYTQFPSQDSGIFGPNPWKILAPPSNYLSTKRCLGNPTLGTNQSYGLRRQFSTEIYGSKRACRICSESFKIHQRRQWEGGVVDWGSIIK